LAIDKSNGNQVAVKIIDGNRIQDLGKVRHVMREKDLLYKLAHPHIVKLYDTFQIDHNLYFIFEYCQNGNLDSLIRKYK
jgi:serine/threonine protein kinase